jgi:MFS family permease
VNLPESAIASPTHPDHGMRPVLPIMAVVSLFFLSIGMALPVLPLHVHDDLGFDPLVVGIVAGSQFVASLVSRVWAGRLADSKGPGAAMRLGLWAAVAGGGLYLLSILVSARPFNAVVALLVGRTLLGAAESLVITGAIVWGLKLLPAERAGKAISWVGMSMFAAMAAGSPIVSVRQSHLEIDPVSRHRVHDEHHAHYGERHDRPAPQAALLLPGT